MTVERDPEDLIAAEIAAAEARGDDPYADKATPEADPGEPPAAEIEAEPAAEKTSQPATSPTPVAAATEPPESQAAPDAEASTPAGEPQPTQFTAAVPDDYKAQRADLLAKKAEAMKGLMDGTIGIDDFTKVDAEVANGLEELTAVRARAEALIEANIQTQQFHQKREIDRLVARTKTEIDYASDQKAVQQFNAALAVVSADPDNADLTYAEMIDTAHKTVAAMRGVRPAKAEQNKPAESKPAPDRTPPKPPITLSGLPTAATPGTKSSAQVLASLKGEDFEKAYDALPSDERAKLLR
jgi:hypothetical protein